MSVRATALLCCALLAAPSRAAHAQRTKAPAWLDVAPLAGIRQLVIPTYDGSGQAVHPDVVRVPGGWHGWELWMAFTPYPRGDRRFENPSIVVSADGEHWSVPAGAKEPVIAPPQAKGSYESDPDLHLDARTQRMVLVYREVTGDSATLRVRESDDGARWSEPRTLLHRESSRIVSPSVVEEEDGRVRLWVVDSGHDGCQATESTVRLLDASSMQALRAPESPRRAVGRAIDMRQPGYVIWHLDVTHLPDTLGYWALYAAYPHGRFCDATDLFIAHSADGVHWVHATRPLLARGRLEWASGALYRGSLLYEPQAGVLRVVFSARGARGAWSLGTTTYRVSELRKAINQRPRRSR